MLRKILICTLFLCAGSAFAETRIVGGKVATEGAWPSTISLIVKSFAEGIDRGEYAFTDTGKVIPANQANYWSHSCGGTLVASSWVITAAHCVVDGETGEKYSNDHYLVLSGISDLLDSGLRTGIKRIVVHPDYNPLSDESSEDSDIALLELSQPLSQTTIKLFTEHPAVGTNTTVTGWGLTKEDGDRSRYLQQVNLPTISNAQCKKSIREYQFPNNPDSSSAVAYVNSTLTDNMFCAGDAQGLRDSCQADSGGPVMALANGEYALLGVVSWGYGCARAGTYGAYTKVSNFFPWVRSVVSPGSTTTTPSNTTPNDDGNSSEDSSGSGGGMTSLVLLAILGLAGVLRSRLRVIRSR